MDHGRRLYDRRRVDARLGPQPRHLLRGARAGRVRLVHERRRMARARPRPAGGATGAVDPEPRLARFLNLGPTILPDETVDQHRTARVDRLPGVARVDGVVDDPAPARRVL